MREDNNIVFNSDELERYSRHLIIPEFNIEGQKKLKSSKVLVVGTGGLGSPLLQYLVAAGVGTIGIVDFDHVDKTNLQRQVLFTVDDLGRPKVEAAKERLAKLNPNVRIVTHKVRLTSSNALEIFRGYDLVADGTDNFPTRYLVNDACVLLGIPNVYASIYRFEGQASVFNYTDKDGNKGPNYRDLFPTPPPPGVVPSCAEGGVLGVLPGILGSIQANEVIKVITGIGESLAGYLFLFDALTFETRKLRLHKNPENPLTGENPTQTGLIDYELFCGFEHGYHGHVKEIDVHELKKMLDKNENIQVIDVREEYEYNLSNIGAELIPLNSILDNHHLIDRQKKVIVHCRSGKRSANAIEKLQERYGFENLYNLKGGILAWANEIDESLIKY